MIVRELNENELPEAVSLVSSVFMEFEAPGYSKEGIEHFEEFIHKNTIFKELKMYGAFIDSRIIGVIATRNAGKHVSLFFVNPDFHRQGVGKALFELVKRDCKGDVLTVNSSPYAVPIYKALGFIPTDVEQLVDGIRFTPMILHME